MSDPIQGQLRGNSGKVLGALLIALGVLFLVGQLFRIDVGHWGWPFFVIVPGAAVLSLGIATKDQMSHPLIVVGSVITAVGLLLLFQNVTDHWASWAYAWALIAPTAVGVGEMIYGSLKDHPQSVTTGRRLVTIGLILFVIGAIFFELVIGIGGVGLSGWVLPVLLIGVGVFLMLQNLIGGQQKP